MPVSAPWFLSPPANGWFLRTAVVNIVVRCNGAGSVSQISNQELDFSTNGGSTWTPVSWFAPGWTTVYDSPPNGGVGYNATCQIAANTFADEATIQIRARYYNNQALAWSSYGYLNLRAADAPVAPTITTPSTNGTTVGKNMNLAWTPAELQSDYEIELRTATGGGGTLLFNQVYNTSDVSANVVMDLTAQTRYVRVRTAYHGIWGAWAERSVVTSFLPPMTPTFTTSKVDPSGLGISDTILFTITNPTPSGGAPNVTDMYIEYRTQGSSEAWKVLDSSIGTSTPFRWRAPVGSWEFRVTAYGATNGTYATSAAGQPQTMTLTGAVLTIPGTLTGLWIPYNDSGAEEEYGIESALIQYQGRSLPVAEYGTAVKRNITVGKLTVLTAAEQEVLRTMSTYTGVILYRDSKGRRAYGLLSLESIKDRVFGYESAFVLYATDTTGISEIGAY